MKEVFDKLKKRIMICATEACGYTPLTRVVSEAELKEIIEQIEDEYSNGHFGCNTNGEHERCDGCGLTDCKSRNKIWFGAGDDDTDTNVGSNGWIPVSERLPEEHQSIFAKFKGTDKWNDAMFEKISDEVNVTVVSEKGDATTTHAHTNDGKWSCDLLKVNKTYRVIAWQPLPQPYHPNTCKDTECPYNDGNDCPAADGCAGYERKRTNFDRCCESMEAMAQIIDIAKLGWTKDQIMEWLQKEECEIHE